MRSLTSGTATVPTVGALPSGIPSLSLPSFDPETWRRLFPTALALTRPRTDRGGVDRARGGRQVRPADRRQPGVHRPGPVQHRRRVRLGVSVVGLVQSQRRQLRSRRANPARGGVLGGAACRRAPRRGAARRLPAAGGDGRAALRRRVGTDQRRGDAPHRAHEPRRGAGARRDLLLDARDPARIRDLRRRARVAARLPPPHDASAPDAGRPGPDVAAAPLHAAVERHAACARSSRCCASTGRSSSVRSSTCATSCTTRASAHRSGVTSS